MLGVLGIGDLYFLLEGNGGYDTQYYDLSFVYDLVIDWFDGVVKICAKVM